MHIHIYVERARLAAASALRGVVCDELKGPMRDHPNSQDPLFLPDLEQYMHKWLKAEEGE